MTFTQINLHHSKGASAILSRKQAAVHTAILLIQESWLVRGRISGVAACGRLFKPPTAEKPRVCVAVKGVDARLIPHLCFRDAVELDVADSLGSRRVVVCSATDTNDRGRRLLEFLASTDLEILSRGNEPIFCTAARGEVTTFRDPRRTDWDSYRVDLKCHLEGFPRRHGTEEELELCVDHLQRALVESYERNCPERAVKNSRGNSWWSPKLQELRNYRDSVVKAQKKSWKEFCESVEGVPETARLCRILARNPDAVLDSISLPDGTMVTRERCLVHLLEASFPGFRREHGELFAHDAEGSRRPRKADWGLAASIVKPGKVRWAINTFKPFKSAGPDQVFPALLQEGLELVVGPLTRTLRACLALGHTPSAWKLASGIHPKSGKSELLLY
ncbi:uncharacterized protein LOC120359948 [Solenopsis invicta]|uniref:uncharacterized protein LOC120358029 n=1 Tax=Solenopsis invicta TaxID=13686 RepID=UPI00193E6A00|nr:uncharacterized protein LOC120358029 [Solenopsis invicta]XP_039315360.1 uncharacterized protein LOC120359948 [Solenopsis invicta]